jgi:hypothetical protein
MWTYVHAGLTLRQLRVAMVITLREYDSPGALVNAATISQLTGIRADVVGRIMYELEELGFAEIERPLVPRPRPRPRGRPDKPRTGKPIADVRRLRGV